MVCLLVHAYTAETVFNTLHLTESFPRSNVYAGALGNDLQLLSPSILEVESTSVSVVGYKEPLLSLSLWTKVKFLPTANIMIWLWLGPLIAVIFVLVTIGTAISTYCYYKKKQYRFEPIPGKGEERQTLMKDVDQQIWCSLFNFNYLVHTLTRAVLAVLLGNFKIQQYPSSACCKLVFVHSR